MRAVKRPIPIEVIRFNGNTTDCPAALICTNGRWEVWNAKHESWIGVAIGDYLNVTTENDVYPIAADVFERTYDVLPD